MSIGFKPSWMKEEENNTDDTLDKIRELDKLLGRNELDVQKTREELITDIRTLGGLFETEKKMKERLPYVIKLLKLREHFIGKIKEESKKELSKQDTISVTSYLKTVNKIDERLKPILEHIIPQVRKIIEDDVEELSDPHKIKKHLKRIKEDASTTHKELLGIAKNFNESSANLEALSKNYKNFIDRRGRNRVGF